MACKPLDDETRERLQASWSDEKQATPTHVLETQVMDSRIPKNEREQWARGEIKRLRGENKRLLSDCTARHDAINAARAVVAAYANYRARGVAAMYGATETTGRWGREKGVYDICLDRTVGWICPDCNHEWPRK